MLVLTRRAGESIMIGDDIVITVIEVSRDQLRVGIDAPRSLAVHRKEVYMAIIDENEAARRSDMSSSNGSEPATRSAALSPSSVPRRPPRQS